MATESYFWASDQAGSKDLIYLWPKSGNQHHGKWFYLGTGEQTGAASVSKGYLIYPSCPRQDQITKWPVLADLRPFINFSSYRQLWIRFTCLDLPRHTTGTAPVHVQQLLCHERSKRIHHESAYVQPQSPGVLRGVLYSLISFMCNRKIFWSN